MNNNNTESAFILSGDKKYTAGLIFLLGSFINFFSSMKKFNYSRMVQYSLIIGLAILGELINLL